VKSHDIRNFAARRDTPRRSAFEALCAWVSRNLGPAALSVAMATWTAVTADSRARAATPDMPQPGVESEPSGTGATEAKPTRAKRATSAGDAKTDASKTDASKTDASKAGDAKSDGSKRDAPKQQAAQQRFDIGEYRVEGADTLLQIEVEEAVYPFLGPDRTADDVEKARAALEKAYHDKGYQTVGVSVPQQDATRGFVVLKVAENRVGRLRVKGSRYFDLDNIKRSAQSLQEGKLPKFDKVTKDIVALNQWPDRRVTPALRAGSTPGTVDVDLNVEDTLPLHGSLELNNRQSPSTTPLRLSASLHYDNLWQLGHSATITYQEAPLNPKDATVVSASYLARTDYDWLNVLIYGLKSDSSVATVGGANVIGPGQVIGARAVLTLPSKGELVHTLSLGADYKNFKQTLSLGSDSFDSPVQYVPVVASYGATWQGEGRLTQLNGTVTAGLRGIGSSPDEFDAKRFKATASFITLRGDVSHTQDLPGGAQLFAKLQGQMADQPLVSSEQFSLGGLDTVRGYLESEVLGDFGGSATVEVRSPNLAPFVTEKLKSAKTEAERFNPIDEWKVFAFGDAGRVQIFDPLPDQQEQFDLASYGIGTRFRFMKYSNGMILLGVPVISQQVTVANKSRVSFRFWGEF
jgi:hemolysin activation/secretion protein